MAETKRQKAAVLAACERVVVMFGENAYSLMPREAQALAAEIDVAVEHANNWHEEPPDMLEPEDLAADDSEGG